MTIKVPPKNVRRGKINGVEYFIDEDAVRDCKKTHGLDLEKEFRKIIEKQIEDLSKQYPNAPVKRF